MSDLLSIDMLADQATQAGIVYADVLSWVSDKWNRLTKVDQYNTIQADVTRLPMYTRNLANMAGALDRARAAGYDSDKISLAQSFLERANTQLQRMSNMVQVALADAKRGGMLDDSYEPGLEGWSPGKVIVVGLSVAAIVATFILVAPWIAAAGLVVQALVAATALVLAAIAWMTAREATLPVSDDGSMPPSVGEVVIQASHSFTAVVAFVAAAFGLWLFTRRNRA